MHTSICGVASQPTPYHMTHEQTRTGKQQYLWKGEQIAVPADNKLRQEFVISDAHHRLLEIHQSIEHDAFDRSVWCKQYCMSIATSSMH